MPDDKPKSAIEIAMERLRQKDAAAGVVPQALTDEQKAAIAEVRSVYEAKLAHADVMHQSTLSRVADPEARANFEAQYRRDRERFVDERESKIAKVRAGGR
jgi:hypothetical protein